MPIYSVPDILVWAHAAQPLAAHGEYKKKYTKGSTVDLDLHLKIMLEREILEWQYSQNPTDTDGILYEQGNYVYALLFPYLFAAQIATGGGGQVITPSSGSLGVLPYYFFVTPTSFIATGQTSVTLPASWIGKGVSFFRGGIVQTDLTSETSYFTYDAASRLMTISPAAIGDELFAIFPI